MTKKEMLSRWRIIRTHAKKMGADAELDMISDHTIVALLGTKQNLSELIEWGYEAWDDVKACWQSAGDGTRSFGITFKREKDFRATGDEEEDDD